MTYTIGSLFSGAGGLDMGVQMALGPADLRWVSDVEPGPCALLAHHWPTVPNLGDITTVDWTLVEPVDVIAGGSPCLDLSTAGRRAGMKPGTRSGLWESMFTAITTIRPHLVVWENVRGAYSADAFSLMESREGRVGGGADGPVLRALGRVLGDLASIGYDAIWTGVRASDVGAPHQRYRVFVTAHPAGDTWWLQHRDGAATGDPERAARDQWGQSAPGEAEGRGARADAGGPDRAPVVLLPTPTTQDTDEACPSQLNRNTVPLNTVVTLLPTPSVADVEGGRKARSGERGDELLLNGLAAANRFGDYAPAIHRWEQALLPAPDPTEPNDRGGRRLSARFVEWMQGMPDGHVTDIGLTRVQQLRILGNGVVPQQAAHALRLLSTVSRAGEVAA